MSKNHPDSFAGAEFARQLEISVKQHALESGAFVLSSTAWLSEEQQAQIMKDTGCPIEPISGGCFTAIISPEGQIIGKPLTSGEGHVVADLDFWLIDKRKRMVDTVGHYTRPEFLSLNI